MNMDTSEYTEELQLEKQLAHLMHPHYSLTYDVNGDYWYMNDRRREAPNFIGYVPKWTRDNEYAFELIVDHNIHFEYVDTQKAVIAVWTEGDYRLRSEPEYYEENKKHAARVAAVKMVIQKIQFQQRVDRRNRGK